MENTIYRYNFSKEFLNKLKKFSKDHKDNDLHEFNDYWGKWKKTNEEYILMESRILRNNGYNGNIDSKMYTSVRYYLKNSIKKNPVKRKKYVGLDKSFLKTIDENITEMLKGNIKPNDGFLEFMKAKKYEFVLKSLILKLNSLNMSNKDIHDKIKKTYKNRFYQMKKKLIN
jgi:hypothetical protein